MNTKTVICSICLSLIALAPSGAATYPEAGVSNGADQGRIGRITEAEAGASYARPAAKTEAPAARAEEVGKAEEEVQNRLNALTKAVDRLEVRLKDIRRQAQQPSRLEIERLEQDLGLADDELNKLTVKSLTGLAELQRSEIQDRLFQLRLSMEIVKRRWGGRGNVFGLDFFTKAPPADASALKRVPRNYVIRSSDTLRVLITSKLGSTDEYHPVVDRGGRVRIPGAGTLSAAGKTAGQFEEELASVVTGRFSQLRVEVTVENISTVQVQVAGEVARPGTYDLPGSATVFTALYQAGGPTENGTFRRIQLAREGGRKTIDLYEFLLQGSKRQDLPLEEGDLVFVPPVGPTVVVEGEVVRPGRYEPDFPFSLEDALKIAGGARSGGYTQTISVERVQNAEYRVLLDVPAGDVDSKSAFQLQPGDLVTVSPVRPDRTNQVMISGPVGSEGAYGFRQGMRVADLVKLAQGIASDKEVYGGRADILRIDPLQGTELITFNLDRALQGDPADNVPLQRLDRVFVYTPNQVVFRPTLVTMMGAVAKPGVYKRTGGMKVSDAIAAAGGVLPQAYLERADLIRYEDGDNIELIPIDLQSALNGNPEANVALTDRDELTIYTQEQAAWRDRTVRIEGAVQRPGVYARPENMRVSDLLFVCGGLLPEAGSTCEVARATESGSSVITKIDLAKLSEGGENDMLLQDRDVVTVPSDKFVVRTPEIVYITGEVARPGPYALTSQDEKLSDLIARAGGLTEFANAGGALFLRQTENLQNPQHERDVSVILQKSRLFADKQFLVQLGKLGVALPESFRTQQISGKEELSKPGEVVADKELEEYVNVQTAAEERRPESVPAKSPTPPDIKDVLGKQREAAAASPQNGKLTTDGLRESETLSSAMGPPLLETDEEAIGSYKGRQKLAEITDSARISVDLTRALTDPNSPDNLTLRSGDRIYIPEITNVVTVIGAVLHPHLFAAGPGKSVGYYIERSGGFSQDASKQHVIVVRANGDALPMAAAGSVNPGDTIVVPNTGLVDIAKKWEKVGSVTKVISEVLSSVFVLTRF